MSNHESLGRRVVCAAICNSEGVVVLGARHHDKLMNQALSNTPGDWRFAEQGFIDQYGVFMTREEAFKVAKAQNQIVRKVGGDETRLFSENLY